MSALPRDLQLGSHFVISTKTCLLFAVCSDIYRSRESSERKRLIAYFGDAPVDFGLACTVGVQYSRVLYLRVKSNAVVRSPVVQDSYFVIFTIKISTP